MSNITCKCWIAVSRHQNWKSQPFKKLAYELMILYKQPRHDLGLWGYSFYTLKLLLLLEQELFS